jgi:putative peptidoglycan lipid II flippase
MVPRTLGIAISQVNLLIITVFASTLAAGSLTDFNLAQNLQSVPLGLFGISFSIAVFPTLSAYMAQNDEKSFIHSFSQTFRQILFFVIPLSIFILLLRSQMVRVIYGAGKFDWEDTRLTFECLGIFTASLFAQSVVPLLARTFYAMHDTKTPFFIAIISEAVNIGTVLLLIGSYKVLSLAIAFSASSIFQMVLLLFVLRSRFENLDDKKILISVFKVSGASILAGIGIQLVKHLVADVVNMDTFLGVFAQLSIASAVGFLTFALVCQLLKLEEFIYFKKSLTSRIFKEKKAIMEDTSDVSGI